MQNRLRHFILNVATEHCQFLRFIPRGWCPTEGTRLIHNLARARKANRPAATNAKRIRLIHVPLLQANRAPRPPPRRLRLRLRIRLASQTSRLVFGRDARADLVGVRPRRGAVDHLGRGRRGFRPRRLRRALVADLLARLAVAAVAPVDALAIGRAIPAKSRQVTRDGAPGRVEVPPTRSRASRRARTVSSRRGSSATSSVWPRIWYK